MFGTNYEILNTKVQQTVNSMDNSVFSPRRVAEVTASRCESSRESLQHVWNDKMKDDTKIPVARLQDVLNYFS